MSDLLFVLADAQPAVVRNLLATKLNEPPFNSISDVNKNRFLQNVVRQKNKKAFKESVQEFATMVANQ